MSGLTSPLLNQGSERSYPKETLLRRDLRHGEAAILDDEVDDFLKALAAREVGEAEGGRLPRCFAGVALHHVEIDVHIGSEVALVDDEEVGAGDAGAALPWDLLALADRDDVEREVGEVGREGGREIVAAGSR